MWPGQFQEGLDELRCLSQIRHPSEFTPEIVPDPKRKGRSSNHHFLGAIDFENEK